MKRVLASPRRRRRLAWLGAAVLVVGGFVAAGIALRDSARTIEPEFTLTGEAEVLRQPRKVALTPQQRARVDETIRRFVEAAVLRRDPDEAWRLAAPVLKVSSSLEEWRAGSLPVQPYPARLDNVGLKLVNAYEDHVEVDVLLLPRRGAGVRAMVVAAELTPAPRGWLVSYWFPRTSLATPEPGGGRAATPAPTAPTRDTTQGRLGHAFFLIPAAILSLSVLTVIAIAVGSWYRGRRAYRRYRSTT